MEGIRKLRNAKKISQNDLAEKLNVSVQTVRNWEKNKAIPPIEYMTYLADALGVDKDNIIRIFDTGKSKVEGNRKRDEESLKGFLELFWAVDNIVKFTTFSRLLSNSGMNGVVYDGESIFPFSKILADGVEKGVVLADDDYNLIVFTFRNVNSVKAISFLYDVYTFELVTNCPIFPNNERDSSSQIIKISIFNRGR